MAGEKAELAEKHNPKYEIQHTKYQLSLDHMNINYFSATFNLAIWQMPQMVTSKEGELGENKILQQISECQLCPHP